VQLLKFYREEFAGQPTNARLSGALIGIKYMSGITRVDIKLGIKVLIVLKKDQKTNKLTEGVVKDILTKSPTHPHGIKVRLESGEVGRVKKILS
jgi:uncharacterized repeat protein (TIGR03833 family)